MINDCICQDTSVLLKLLITNALGFVSMQVNYWSNAARRVDEAIK